MSQTLLNRTTATKENALTTEERDEFLSELRIGRLASQREDGWPHVTPIWYVWDDGRFVLTLGKSRRHLVNIARGRLLRAREAGRGPGGGTRDHDKGRAALPAGRRTRPGAGRAAVVRGTRRGADRAGALACLGSRQGLGLDADLDALRRGAEHVCAPVLRDHAPQQREPARACPERVRRQPHVPRRDRLDPVALQLRLLAVPHAEVQRQAVEELEQLVVLPAALRLAAELRLLLRDEGVDIALDLRGPREPE